MRGKMGKKWKIQMWEWEWKWSGSEGGVGVGMGEGVPRRGLCSAVSGGTT
jgi:hypothetical protein